MQRARRLFISIFLITSCISLTSVTADIDEAYLDGEDSCWLVTYLSSTSIWGKVCDALVKGARDAHEIIQTQGNDWHDVAYARYLAGDNENYEAAMAILAGCQIASALQPSTPSPDRLLIRAKCASSDMNTHSQNAIATYSNANADFCGARSSTLNALADQCLAISRSSTCAAITPAQSTEQFIMTAFNDILSTKREKSTLDSRHWRVPELSKKIPELTNEGVAALYQGGAEFLNGGMGNIIATVHIAKARENLVAGTKIAVRLRKGGIPWQPNLDAYAMLTDLRAKNITDYIPKMFAVYYSPLDESIFERVYKKYRQSIPYSQIEVTEIEFLDGPDYSPFELSKIVPAADIPRVLVLEAIGTWAVRRVAKMDLSDPDGDVSRHHLLTYDDNYVVYHIGDEAYLFEPGFSPRQVDYDSHENLDREFDHDYIVSASQVKKVPYSGSRFCGYEDWMPENVKPFFHDFCNGKGLFNSIKEHFSDYKISVSRPMPTTKNIKHYYIPDDYLIN